MPSGLKPDSLVELWGGGVFIFDQFGVPKCHQHKDVNDWARQNKRLKRLANNGPDSDGRFGFDRAYTGALLLHQSASERRGW